MLRFSDLGLDKALTQFLASGRLGCVGASGWIEVDLLEPWGMYRLHAGSHISPLRRLSSGRKPLPVMRLTWNHADCIAQPALTAGRR